MNGTIDHLVRANETLAQQVSKLGREMTTTQMEAQATRDALCNARAENEKVRYQLEIALAQSEGMRAELAAFREESAKTRAELEEALKKLEAMCAERDKLQERIDGARAAVERVATTPTTTAPFIPPWHPDYRAHGWHPAVRTPSS